MASYKKLKNGWQCRVSYKGEDGKYKTKSKNGFRTKAEAQAYAENLEKQLRQGISINNNETYAEYMTQWYLTFKKDVHSADNNYDIELAIKWVKTYFKNTLLKDVTREKYQNFLNWYGKDRATASVRKVHIYASSCLDEAFNQGHIPRNPAWKISVKGNIPAKKDSEKFLNYKDTQKLLKEVYKMKEDHARCMILIALATGKRFSEVLALNWDDIDFKKETIDVNKTFDYRNTHDFAPTKSEASVRTVSIDKETVKYLKEFKMSNDIKYGNNLFLEKTIDGYRHISNKKVNKELKRACKAAKVKEMTFHSLRHTHCSLLIYSGANIKYISQRLGHSSTDITYKIYGHIIAEMEEKENQEVKNFIEELLNAK